MNGDKILIFVDGEAHQSLLPLTFTRPAAALRLGIVTIAEKWALRLNLSHSFYAEPYLQGKYPVHLSDDNLLVFGCVIPTDDIIQEVENLEKGVGLFAGDRLMVARGNRQQCRSILQGEWSFLEKTELATNPVLVTRPYHLVALNKQEIARDFELLTRGRVSHPLSPTVSIVGVQANPDLVSQVFLEPGVVVEHVLINPTKGPVYIGRDALIMEGSMVQGPFAMCDHAQVNMGAKIYGGTTLGPWCKAGGEVNNALLLGYSNKGHDGFLGDSVIGEWCNLGADTNTSNLKNDFAEVKLWDYTSSRFLKTGMQFLGLIMGDYSRCGINSMFNSGTVVGIACNLHGSGYPRNFIPSFSMGGAQGFKTNSLREACKTAVKAMERRQVEFAPADETIIQEVFELTRTFRTF